MSKSPSPATVTRAPWPVSSSPSRTSSPTGRAVWGGLGLYANYTYVDSDAEVPDRESTSLPGQSEHIGNLALVYEKYGITTRLSYNYNGKKLSRSVEIRKKTSGSTTTPSSTSCSEFRSSKKFSIVFEAINITDEPYTAYEDTPDRIRQQEYYGWWATLGVRFDL